MQFWEFNIDNYFNPNQVIAQETKGPLNQEDYQITQTHKPNIK